MISKYFFPLFFIGTLFVVKFDFSINAEFLFINAIFDFVKHGKNIAEYSHLTQLGHDAFSFVPVLFFGVPLKLLMRFGAIQWLASNLGSMPLKTSLLLCRLLLCFVSSLSVSAFLDVISSTAQFQGVISGFFVAVFVFFNFVLNSSLSRFTDATFSLISLSLALKYFVENNLKNAFVVLSAASIFVDSKMIFFMPLLFILSLKKGFTKCVKAVIVALPAAIVFSLLSLVLDSYFWQERMVPNFRMFQFKLLMMNRTKFGVMSPFWYFVEGFPSFMANKYMATLPTIGLFTSCLLMKITLPFLLYVAALSTFPHKSVDFIIPGIVLTLVASARMCSFASNFKLRSPFLKTVRSFLLAALTVFYCVENLKLFYAYRSSTADALAWIAKQPTAHQENVLIDFPEMNITLPYPFIEEFPYKMVLGSTDSAKPAFNFAKYIVTGKSKFYDHFKMVQQFPKCQADDFSKVFSPNNILGLFKNVRSFDDLKNIFTSKAWLDLLEQRQHTHIFMQLSRYEPVKDTPIDEKVSL